ncbi:MAG: DnaJ domain-containing protein [Clostridia bacterium]|nr:DnaJ domain-containing protein [Clostridia bacterium]
MKNYYEILEVDRQASLKVIKGVYKIHIKNKHPDLYEGEEKLKAEEEIKVLNEAYEILSNEEKRKEYDKQLAETASLDEELLEETLKENEYLKKRLQEYEGSEFNKLNQEVDSFEPHVATTEENNAKYLLKLMYKERIARIIITAVLIFAAIVGIYKATHINIIEKFFETLATFLKG